MTRSFAGLALLLCVHCGGQTKPAEEAAPPSAPSAEPTAEATPPPAEPEPAEAPSAAASAAPAASASPAKKPCDKLPKSECKVRTGCAWNDIKKCVTEGPE